MRIEAEPTLQSWKGKNIKDICENGYTNDAHNHCAHFVAHAKGYSYGYTCRNQTGKGPGRGASIRVNDVFAQCGEVGKFSDKPATVMNCLVFVTDASNVKLAQKKMTDHPQKHIGIFSQGEIFHYSNGEDKVISETPQAFEARFKSRYSGKNITVFYGTFPV